MSSTELEEYSESLLADLKKLEGAFASWEENPTKKDTGDKQPIRINGWKWKEAHKELPKDLEVVVD